MYPNPTKQKQKGLIAASDALQDYTNLGVNCPQQQSNSSHPTLVPGAGVEAVLSLLNNCAGKRPFWPAEKLIISQFREWSPMEDLEVVHSAMVMQKELLLQRIRCHNPLFTEPLSAVRPSKNVVINESNIMPHVDSGAFKTTSLPAVIPFVTTHSNLSVITDLPDLFADRSQSKMDLDPSTGEVVPPEEVDLRDGETMYVVFQDDLFDGDGEVEMQGVVKVEDCQEESDGNYYELDGNENADGNLTEFFDDKHRKGNVDRPVGKTNIDDGQDQDDSDGDNNSNFLEGEDSKYSRNMEIDDEGSLSEGADTQDNDIETKDDLEENDDGVEGDDGDDYGEGSTEELVGETEDKGEGRDGGEEESEGEDDARGVEDGDDVDDEDGEGENDVASEGEDRSDSHVDVDEDD